MITVSNLKKVYTQNSQVFEALKGIDLQVSAGEIYGVLGPSGAGKSTLIRCINLLERPTSGSIRINGQELTTLTSGELRKARQSIGMIFQHFNLLNHRTVEGNVAFPLEITGVAKSEQLERVAELLSLVGLLDKAKSYPAQLSGGQKQRVGIARALATQPNVLLSDEATSSLDPQNTTMILELLKDLNRRLGLTILLITHEMNVVKQICDRVAVLESGMIVEQGKTVDLVAQPESQLAQALFPPVDVSAIIPGATIAKVTFVGESADKPILAGLMRRFDIELNILGGSIQNINGQRIGQLQVEISGPGETQALAYLRELGVRVEVN